MKKLTYFFCLLTTIGITFSCSKSDDGNPKPDPNPSGSTAGPKFLAVKAIINSSCALSGCHIAPSNTGGINFQSDANIVSNGSRIKTQAVDLGTMPPTGSLSADDKAKITDWILAGGMFTN
jgi:uncharacterized membrane protein